jgi:hypothetical protein
MTRRVRNQLVMIVALVVAPTLAFGQVSLTELGAANAARNDLMANGGKAAAKAGSEAVQPAPIAPAAGPKPTYGMKYALSYALAGMLVGLGMYLTCRPSNRHAVE